MCISMCVCVCVYLCVCVCVCVCAPSVLTRLLESDKKTDWTRLEYEYRAGEKGERERGGEKEAEDDDEE